MELTLMARRTQANPRVFKMGRPPLDPSDRKSAKLMITCRPDINRQTIAVTRLLKLASVNTYLEAMLVSSNIASVAAHLHEARAYPDLAPIIADLKRSREPDE